MIGGFRSVLVVLSFKVCCFVIVLFRAIIDWLSLLLSFFFFVFLILVTFKNKAMSDSFLWQRNPLTIAISFAILEQSRVILSQAERAICYIVICINPAFTKMFDGTGKPKIPSKFAKCTAWYNKFHCKYMLWSNGYPHHREFFFLQGAMRIKDVNTIFPNCLTTIMV